MPVGKPEKFVGDIRKYDPSAFGFFFVKITSSLASLASLVSFRVLASQEGGNAYQRLVLPLVCFASCVYTSEAKIGRAHV